MSLIVAISLALVGLSSAKTLAVEGRHETSHHWELVMDEESLLHSNPTLAVRLALKHRNMDTLRDLVAKLSDPTHPQYQDYMTVEEIDKLVSPNKFRVDALVKWLTSLNSPPRKVASGYVEVDLPVAVITKTFQSPIVLVSDVERGMKFFKFSSDSYSLPDEFVDVIAFVQDLPFWRIVSPARIQQIKPEESTNTEYDVAIQTIRNLYSIPKYTFTQGDKSSLGVMEFGGGYSNNDVKNFLAGMGEVGPSTIQTVGAYNPEGGCVECALDLQLQAGLGSNATLWYYTSTQGFFFLTIAQEWYDNPTPPLVNSISYITPDLGSSDQLQTDQEYTKLAARGVSVVASSGDSGAHGSSGCEFTTYYPAASPYVTSAGATMINAPSGEWQGDEPPYCVNPTLGHPCAVTGSEIPADNPAGIYPYFGFYYASGGGQSGTYPLPSWQQQAVTSFYPTATHRAYPDISANGLYTLIFFGQWQWSGGTSAAAPIVASIFAIWNDYLSTQGKQPLGFATPFLYTMPASVISSNGNAQTNNNAGCPTGYVSNPDGYDCVTGLGTINVTAGLDYIQKNLAMFKDRP